MQLCICGFKWKWNCELVHGCMFPSHICLEDNVSGSREQCCSCHCESLRTHPEMRHLTGVDINKTVKTEHWCYHVVSSHFTHSFDFCLQIWHQLPVWMLSWEKNQGVSPSEFLWSNAHPVNRTNLDMITFVNTYPNTLYVYIIVLWVVYVLLIFEVLWTLIKVAL